MTQEIGCSFAVFSVGGRGNAVPISARRDVLLPVSVAQSLPTVARMSGCQ
ncbi:hypothetical protein M0D44_05545 [Xanthomonas prunicola]|nr:hypothetical protein [Xanthomonas prunicola]UXA50003.1 hypothetical protein M0D44_05545 [Xanthomonas prunicola]UXA52270.1 hypothetical protein M0D45_16535 [Xanthomonas prunicola]